MVSFSDNLHLQSTARVQVAFSSPSLHLSFRLPRQRRQPTSSRTSTRYCLAIEAFDHRARPLAIFDFRLLRPAWHDCSAGPLLSPHRGGSRRASRRRCPRSPPSSTPLPLLRLVWSPSASSKQSRSVVRRLGLVLGSHRLFGRLDDARRHRRLRTAFTQGSRGRGAVSRADRGRGRPARRGWPAVDRRWSASSASFSPVRSCARSNARSGR